MPFLFQLTWILPVVTLTKYQWHIDNLPVGTNLTFTIYKNGLSGQLITIVTGGLLTGNGTLGTPISLTIGDIVSIKITGIGTPPNEGGNDLTISLY